MSEISRPTSAATVLRGSAWEVFSRALPQFYVVVSSAFVARYLGAAAMGQVTLIATVELMTTALVMVGRMAALPRFVGQLLGAGRGGEARWLVDRVRRAALPSSLLAFSAPAGASFILGGPRSAWLLAGVAAMLAVQHAVPSAFLMGVQRWREARIIGVSTGLVAMAAKVAVVVSGGGIPDLFAVDACVVALNLIGTWTLALPLLRGLPRARPDGALRREFSRYATIAAIGIAINLVVNQRIEVFFLAHFASKADVARYSVPFSFVVALLWIPLSVSLVLTPAVATLWGAGEVQRIRSGYARVVRLTTLIALVLTGLAVSVGGPIVELVYGPQFGGLRNVVLVLVVSVPFVPLATLSGGVLRGIGYLWGLTLVGIFAMLVDLGLSWALVPPWHVIGAAASNTIAQVIWAVPMLAHARRRLGGVEIGFRSLGRAVVAVAAAAAAGLAVSASLPVAAGVVAGSAAFIAMLVLAAGVLRPLPATDGVWIEAVAGDRFRGIVRAGSRFARGERPLFVA